MSDAPSAPEPVSGPMNRHAAEWGLAALLIAGFQLLLVPGIVLIGIMMWGVLRNDERSGAGDALVWCWLARLGVGFALTACVINLLIALRACVLAYRLRQPAGLPVAGLILALITLPIWILGTIAFLWSTENLRILYQLREDRTLLQGVWTKASIRGPQGKETPPVELHIIGDQLRLQTTESVPAAYWLNERWWTYLNVRWAFGEGGTSAIRYTVNRNQLELTGQIKGYDVSGTWQRKMPGGP
jgi:hypothetical protein